jgi:hypothetical protein
MDLLFSTRAILCSILLFIHPVYTNSPNSKDGSRYRFNTNAKIVLNQLCVVYTVICLFENVNDKKMRIALDATCVVWALFMFVFKRKHLYIKDIIWTDFGVAAFFSICAIACFYVALEHVSNYLHALWHIMIVLASIFYITSRYHLNLVWYLTCGRIKCLEPVDITVTHTEDL